MKIMKMGNYSNRRKLLLAAVSAPWLSACSSWADKGKDGSTAQAQLAGVEKTFDGRIGLFALDTGNGAQLGYRAGERFPMCSTFKVVLASAILERSKHVAGLMQQRIQYGKSDLVSYSPITEKHVDDGMTVAELCGAALQYSDNTSSNLLMKILGGPAAVTAYARTSGDAEFRLDRWETDLNSAIPDDPRDTSTPGAMGHSLQRLALGDALEPQLRDQLQNWMHGNTTGAGRIRAGVPVGWQVADKTGGGNYGTANDIAVLWPTGRAPVVLAIYTTQREKAAKARIDVIASATRIAIDWLG